MTCPWPHCGWAVCERGSYAAMSTSPRRDGWLRWRKAGANAAWVWLVLWALWSPLQAHSQNRVVLPTATDLPQALAQALALGQPLVVMVSLDNCPYCRQVRQSHLGPMWRGGQVVVQIDMQHKETLTDWDGQTRSHGDWVKNRRISVAPTVLFFWPGWARSGRSFGGSFVARLLRGLFRPAHGAGTPAFAAAHRGEFCGGSRSC